MSNEIKMPNIPEMSVGKMVDVLADAYCKLIENGAEIKMMPSVMLWGPPGVGKSQGVRQIAAEIGERTGKRVKVTDVRLLLFNPVDLRGIPTSNEDKTLAVWLKPKIFQMDDSKDVINILFMDEISAAPQSVQAAAYQITLDRTVGEHKLPDNCIVIAAGNRTTDKSVAYKMPKALANRLMHIETKVDFKAWKKWALRAGINEKVIGFLSFRQVALNQFNPGSEDLAFPTPRSWEMVSNLLNNVTDDVDVLYQMIAGLVGISVATEFKTWVKIYMDLPDMGGIFNGTETKVPKQVDALYALVSSIAVNAKKHKNDLDKMRNAIVYANRLPADFSVILIKDLMYIEKDYAKTLMKIPEFSAWLSKKGSLLNGNI